MLSSILSRAFIFGVVMIFVAFAWIVTTGAQGSNRMSHLSATAYMYTDSVHTGGDANMYGD
jgi:hypothetical protein